MGTQALRVGMVKATERKRLFFDIETSPYIGLFWRPGYKISVSPENIITEAAIICICWKWEGQKAVHSLTWDENHCDREMIEEFAPILDSADEAVAHYGDGFDIKWVRTQCLRHGVSLSPRITTIDTWKVAKYGFNFPSNRLNDIAQTLSLGRKDPMKFDDWKRVMTDFPGALAKMVRYCKNDVRLLEAVWQKLSPYVRPKTHMGVYISDCPECGSKNTIMNQNRPLASGYRTVTMKCSDCGKYHSFAESRIGKLI